MKRYRIGWMREDGRWTYIVVRTLAEMLDVVAEKVTNGDRVTVHVLSGVTLGEEK